MKVPILRLSYGDDQLEELQTGLAEILRSGRLSAGQWTLDFESRFAQFCGTRYAVACTNGTAALELILRGLEIEKKSVIVPTNTFMATALAVMNTGNRVIFADCDTSTFCLDPEDVAGRIREDTAAVILVHIGGVITPAITAIRALCHRRGLHLIEDCAHAHGSRFQTVAAGAWGVAGAFSFFPTKVLTTGEGGMVTTNDEHLAERMRMLRNHGKNPNLANHISEYGTNHRISEITALLGVAQMKRAQAMIAARRQAADTYDSALQSLDGLHPLPLDPSLASSYYKYIVVLAPWVNRTRLKSIMAERYGVSLTGEVYADLCHREPIWKRHAPCGFRRQGATVSCGSYPGCGCQLEQGSFPESEIVSRQHVCLPVYPGITKAELDQVVVSLQMSIEEMRGNE